MKFLRLPSKIALQAEIDKNEDMNLPTNWTEGFILVNISEIQEIVQGIAEEGGCSIFYKNGDSSKIDLSLDELAMLLE